jgi:hypothetical protein
MEIGEMVEGRSMAVLSLQSAHEYALDPAFARDLQVGG